MTSLQAGLDTRLRKQRDHEEPALLRRLSSKSNVIFRAAVGRILAVESSKEIISSRGEFIQRDYNNNHLWSNK